MLKTIPILFLLLVWALCGLAAHAEEPGGPEGAKEYPEKYLGKVRAELLLDEATGRLTYLLRCTSDEPIKLHLESLNDAEINFNIEPDTEKVCDFNDNIWPTANMKTFPYFVRAEMMRSGTPDWKKFTEEEEREKTLDRVVELKKDEAVLRTFYLYDTPWFDDLVKALEKKKFKAYRIDPWPAIYTADANGKPVRDHRVEVRTPEWGADGSCKLVYRTGGLSLDLAKVKKIHALRPKLPPPPPPEIAMQMVIRPQSGNTTVRKGTSWDDRRERGKQYRVVMDVRVEGGKFVPGSAQVVGFVPDTLKVVEGEGKNWKIEESSESRALFVRAMPAEEKPEKKVFSFNGRFQPQEGVTTFEWKIMSTLFSE